MGRIVYVPIPESLLMAFYGWVGQQEVVSAPGGNGHGARQVATQSEPESEGFWTREKIERFRREYQNRVVRTLLDLCAERPEQDITGGQVEKAAGVEMPKLRAGLAGMTMFLKARFGAGDFQDWPITWAKGPDGFIVYRMSPRIASWWKGEA